MTTQDIKKTPAEMRAELEAAKADAIAKLEAKFTKQEKDLAEAESREILSAKRVEITQARREFYAELIDSLAVEIPESGLVLDDVITMTRDSQGVLIVSIAEREVKARATRAANGTSGVGKIALNANTVPGFTGYSYKGSDVKNASKICIDVFGVDPKDTVESGARMIVKLARDNREQANAVGVKIGDSITPLGDLIATHDAFKVTTPAVSPSATTETPSADVAPAPAPVA